MAASTPPLVNLPPGSERVTDADEEVFLLYSLLSSSSPGSEPESGLGFVDAKKGEITVSFDIPPPLVEASSPHLHGTTGTKHRDRHRRRRSSGKMDTEGKHIEVTLAQDLGGLRNRKGDTGSVLWRASMHLAQQLLQEHHYPPTPPLTPLLSPCHLPSAHILELGSGTGLLPVLLSPLVRNYTATDLAALLPLLRKNAASNGVGEKVAVEELDWAALMGLSEERRKLYFPLPDPPELVLAVDCLYNPSLLRPFLATLSYLCHPSTPTPSSPSDPSDPYDPPQKRPVALVMSELRDPEVMREFLALWLELDRDQGGWE
ncbi:hypothetical protein CALCODRAFT_557880, partial [Calocera cornea HHB12733]